MTTTEHRGVSQPDQVLQREENYRSSFTRNSCHDHVPCLIIILQLAFSYADVGYTPGRMPFQVRDVDQINQSLLSTSLHNTGASLAYRLLGSASHATHFSAQHLSEGMHVQ